MLKRNMARDYYREAEAIAASLRLKASLLTSWADRIEESISSGSMATEILLRIRYEIREMLNEESLPLSDGERTKAAELADAIELVLDS